MRLPRAIASSAWVLLWLLPACAGRRVGGKPPEEPAPPVAPAGQDVLDKVEAELEVQREFREVMSERLYAMARRQRDAGDVAAALDTVNQALHYEPTSEKALRLRDELLRSLGDRAGETRTLLDDHWAAYKAKQQERKIAIRVWIRRAEKAAEAGDYEEAKRAYQRALFILEMSR